MLDESRPQLRASDGDREQVATRLRDNCAQGRLSMTELDERLGQVYAARTHGELLEIVHDLPTFRYPLPVPDTGRDAVPAAPPARLPAQLATWLALAVLLVTIAILTVTPEFWPKWPLGLLAAAGVGGWLREQGGHDRRRRGDR